MKKLLLLITGLLLLFSVEGQILRYSNYTAPAEGDYYAEFQTVYDAFAAKPHADTAAFMETLVYSLDTLDFEGGESVWDRMDLFYVFAGRDGADALINWVNPGTYDAANISETSFTAYEGFAGDGSSDYINTSFSLTDATYSSINSISVGVYLVNNIQDGGYVYGTNISATSNALYFRPRGADNILYYKINQTGATTINPNNDASGFYIANRSSSTSTAIYRNGASIGSGSPNSISVNDLDIFILARNADGSASGFSSHKISLFYIMDEITDDEASAINTVIINYLTSIGLIE